MLSFWLPYLFYMAFQPFVQAESTAGMFYVTDLAYKGLVTFSNAITISTIRVSPLSDYNYAKSSCRKDCTKEPFCLAYQIQIFTSHSNCVLLNENLCTKAMLVNATNLTDPENNVIWEKINGQMSAASCLSMQRAQMLSADIAPVIPSTFNASLPANISGPATPKLCSDYYNLSFRYDGDLVPVWPWGYGNSTVKVRCYGMYTAFFTNSYSKVFFNERFSFWVLNATVMSEPNRTQVDTYYRSINFTLLAYMVNLPLITPGATGRKLVFKLTCRDCDDWWCSYKKYEVKYFNFNITYNGTLILGAYESGVGNGLGSPNTYPFLATGDCGPFWKIDNNDSCSQKSYLLRSQTLFRPLKWDGKFCTEAAILFQ